MKARKDTAFTVELLGLFILLIMVITIISSVFVMSRAHSLQARQLTEAVILAENTAEAASAAPDNDSLMDVTSGLDNCIRHSSMLCETDDSDGASVMFGATIKGGDTDKGNVFLVRVTRTYKYGTVSERFDGGTYAENVIEVFDTGGKDPGIGTENVIRTSDITETSAPLYTLTSGTYFGPDAIAKKGGES